MKTSKLKESRLSTTPYIAESACVTNCNLGRYTEISDHAVLAESSLGDYSYVMQRCDIIYTDIGKFSNIASDVRINPGNHPVEWVSQHHFLYRLKQYELAGEDNESFFKWRSIQRVHIGHDTWIGHRAIILPGITIGNGAVIAAGSVVTKDVAPYTIVGGVPAKQIRQRFPSAIGRSLEKIGWWHWSHEQLRERLEDFYNIREFIHKYNREK